MAKSSAVSVLPLRNHSGYANNHSRSCPVPPIMQSSSSLILHDPLRRRIRQTRAGCRRARRAPVLQRARPAICFCGKEMVSRTGCRAGHLLVSMQALIGCRTVAAAAGAQIDCNTEGASGRARHISPYLATSCCRFQILWHVTPHLAPYPGFRRTKGLSGATSADEPRGHLKSSSVVSPLSTFCQSVRQEPAAVSCMNHNTAVNGQSPASRRTGADRRRRGGARETYIPRSRSGHSSHGQPLGLKSGSGA
ncbi:hypothetical protein B0I37DRAFT_62496 [Chaetomium sp. MPI-CAGE-AT-0009]|nr:hypothetical protein B0I37DRAFT_62496 [Chaetomium sp. MPI-CAGE-AT-0009]